MKPGSTPHPLVLVLALSFTMPLTATVADPAKPAAVADAEPASVEAAAVREIPLDDFLRHTDFDNIKISPNGEYLAAAVKIAADNGALFILRRSDLTRTGTFKLGGRNFVSEFHWVSPTRVVLSVAASEGSRSNPALTGEIFATDYDGTNQEVLLSPRSPRSGDNIAFGFFVDTVPGADDQFLVTVGGVGTRPGTDFPRFERMNARTGARSLIARAPIANASFLADQQQKARLAWGTDVNNRQQVFYRGPKGGDWRVINDENESDSLWFPRFVYPDGQSALIQKTGKTGPDGLYRYEFESGKTTLVVRDPTVEPWFVGYALDRSEPVAVGFMDGGPKLTLLNRDSPLVDAWAALIGANPGTFAVPTSQTRDGNLIVFRVSSDRNPGEYFLFDREKNQATYLLSARKWIKPDEMATMEPITVKARDGLTLHGYLTRPVGSDGKKLPLILNPHGGPIGPFDMWGFNPEAQFFANRGYAWAQINFRGSGNYGLAFLRAGYRQWGDGMIDDMTDTVRHLVAEGIVDPERVCIYGGSYGGYAAAQSAVREPNVYRCLAGYVGVYDMPYMFSSGDIPDIRGGSNFLREALGDDPAFLTRISPVHNAAAITIPVFLAAGNDDERAPPEHSERLRDALTEAGNPPEVFIAKDFEGHGFFKLENNRELYSRLLAFFDKHIGDREAAAEPDGAAEAKDKSEAPGAAH